MPAVGSGGPYQAHNRLQVLCPARLVGDAPGDVPPQRPTRDRADERLRVPQVVQQERQELRQVVVETVHAAVSDGAQGEDAALAVDPIGRLEVVTKGRQQRWEQCVLERRRQNIQRRRRALYAYV